mmetsp:Transcript_40716/g.115247  ORF Transcript_40716/g.115247 Transcript_40716/m.115247 type:complete len:279 (+) Transcript_40716:293-1129(+)
MSRSSGTVRRGSSFGSGSLPKTSSAALKRSSFRYFTSASSSTTPPRDTFTRRQLGRRRFMSVSETRPSVLGASGTQTHTTSASRKSEASEPTYLPPNASNPGSCLSEKPTRPLTPKAVNSSARRMPIFPTPTIPTVFDCSSSWGGMTHWPALTAWDSCGSRRRCESTSPKTSSAVASVEYPGTFTTATPLARHAAESTWSTPENATATSLSLGALASVSAVTGAPVVTMTAVSAGISASDSTHTGSRLRCVKTFATSSFEASGTPRSPNPSSATFTDA